MKIKSKTWHQFLKVCVSCGFLWVDLLTLFGPNAFQLISLFSFVYSQMSILVLVFDESVVVVGAMYLFAPHDLVACDFSRISSTNKTVMQ